jgi:hypothetical protein
MAHLTPLPRDLQTIVVEYLVKWNFNWTPIFFDIRQIYDARLELPNGWEPWVPVKELMEFINMPQPKLIRW